MTSISYDETHRNPELDYHALNAKLNLLGEDGKLQLNADKEATRQFFLQHVNQNTVYFHDLEEKIEFLIDNGYYEEDFIEQYEWDFVKRLYKKAYSYKYRFETFLGAFKYYSSYTLKTFDGKRYLERFEDRCVANALYLGRGDEKLAESLLEEIISGRYQPATPTFLNAGKAQRGELVSCFKGDTKVTTLGGVPKEIKDISVGDMVLTHKGRYRKVEQVIKNESPEGFNMVALKASGIPKIIETDNHPVLVWSEDENESRTFDPKLNEFIPDFAPNDKGKWLWVAAANVKPYNDWVFVPSDKNEIKSETIELYHYVENDSRSGFHGKESVDPDNPWEICDDGFIRYRASKTSKIKDHKYSKNRNPIKNVVDIDGDFGVLAGYYLSEGHTSKSSSTGNYNGVTFTFGSHEEFFIEDCARIIKEKFGVAPTVNKSNSDGSTRVSVSSVIIARLFIDMFGTGFNKKTISDKIVYAGDNVLYGLLLGLFRGDGCVTHDSAILTLTNDDLVRQVAHLFNRLGMTYWMRAHLSSSGKMNGTLSVQGNTKVTNDFILDLKKTPQRYIGARRPRGHEYVFRSEYGAFHKVVSLEEAPKETTVYNLVVEEDHTYTTEGVVQKNCFLLRVEDNMESIAKAISHSLQLSKRGGGVALNLSNLREAGAPIKHIENQASGIVPVMKILEDSFTYANQLGARQGAGAVYLNAHHPDIMQFLDTKRENADEKIRIKTLSLGVVIPDITFELAKNNESMYLFSPYDVERFYGKPFCDISITEKYHEMVDNPLIRKKKINARRLFQTIAEIQFESGYPYILFEDSASRQNPGGGRINMSNLCSEILEENSPSTYNEDGHYDHVGRDISCNLGSLNIAHTFDSPDFEKTIETCVRALTAVSETSNIKSVPSIERGNKLTHAIGLGQMNLHGFLAREHILYASHEAVDFSNIYAATVRFYAIKASHRIAVERKERFYGFESSKYADGSVFDMYLEHDYSKPETTKVQELFARSNIKLPTQDDWRKLKEDVMRDGIFNKYLLAIAPTGSISYIAHATSSIHPVVRAIETRKEGKLGRVYYPVPFLNDETLPYFKDAYAIGPNPIIDVYAAFTRHTDQGLSLTLFYTSESTTRDLNKAYIYAFSKGIKTLYYARVRAKAVDGTEVEGTAAEYCEACQI